MMQGLEATSGEAPAPVRVSRFFAAPRERVFQAWSSADHVKRWFCPAVFTVPNATVEMRVGGTFEVCMRAPDGTEHWTRGTFAEVSPVDRLVLDLYATDAAGARLFRAYTEVDFTAEAGGTRMQVVQTYTFEDPRRAASMVAGAPVGWSQTLDKLAAEIGRMQAAGDTPGSVVHDTFQLERTYDASVEAVFRALSDESAKAKWFVAPSDKWTLVERQMDCRPGGRERLVGRWESGVVTTFDAIYHDVVPSERLVYTYEMHQDDRKISVSLATLQLKPAGEGGTTLTVTEQGAFLDGYDDGGSRQRGTAMLLERLGESLA